MRSFLTGEGVSVTFLRYFERPHMRTASAQLNIHSTDEHIVRRSDFWPKGIFIKPWIPRDQFLKGHSYYNVNHD